MVSSKAPTILDDSIWARVIRVKMKVKTLEVKMHVKRVWVSRGAAHGIHILYFAREPRDCGSVQRAS